jgi:DMSO/TMAO reductase YedYZ molybdopterin-dependent catalytic subunit
LSWVCVTGWTRHGLDLYGIRLSHLASLLAVKEAKFVRQVSADGYETSVFFEDVKDDAFLCLGTIDEQGERVPLSRDHGLIRLVCPSLFGWKSAKFLTELEFSDEYSDGFWECLACHARGRISFDERWKEGAGEAVWPKLIALHQGQDFARFYVVCKPWFAVWMNCGLYFFTMQLGAKILSFLVRMNVIKKKKKK